MKKRIDIDTNEIIRLYETEMLSFAEIAKVLGTSYSKVYRRYLKTGRTPRKRGLTSRKSRFTADDIDRILKKYEAGDSSIILAMEFGCMEFGCSDVHIRSLLHQHGAKVRTVQEAQQLRRAKGAALRPQKTHAHRPETLPTLEELPAVVKKYRADGLLIDEIAQRTGITRLEVFDILNSS